MNAQQISNGGHHEAGDSQMLHQSSRVRSAAQRYADAIATDDAGWVRAFLVALNAGGRLLHADSPGRTSTDTHMPSAALLHNDRYAAYARALYCGTLRAAMGAVPARSSEHRECVVIRTPCGLYAGVVIAPHAVLTTAYIVSRAAEAEVVIDGAAAGQPLRIPVADTVIHYAFDTTTHANDIGLLLLANPVSGVSHARLASTQSIDMTWYARVVGFGHGDRHAGVPSGVKRLVLLPLASTGYRDSAEENGYGNHKDLELVAGKPALARDGCMSDGGEPLYVRHADRWRLAGIRSRPVSGHQLPCGAGDIHVRVDRYAAWIRAVISQ